MGVTKPTVLPSARLSAADVIDSGDTLALRFSGQGGDVFVLVPVEEVAGVAAALAAGTAQALRVRAATLQGRPLPLARTMLPPAGAGLAPARAGSPPAAE
ncbi:hypothetical protein M446_0198 [Methylobacterium sp. 4-46]|uniref:hypothetical protein n=1 Tax=unclassified Methylobacterium TaxID=2615210 RepID=UPI000165C8C9|nr:MULTISPECIES: hypothetical protein [Methylobacterium]ACA14772.1 hypothetical protein M446_0198 [Methylobacterium sp. 4-46]WFT80522.1 hypothetical protein QA634_01005 [Methylobacterium nodulans]